MTLSAEDAGALITSLYGDLAKRSRRGELCEHSTLRPSYLPCPHPDCYTPGPYRNPISVIRPPDAQTGAWSVAHVEPSTNPTLKQERWAISSFSLEGVAYWGWRRVS